MPRAQAGQLNLFTSASLGLTGLAILLLIGLIVYLYRWRRLAPATANQALPQLEEIKRLLPELGDRIERAESRILRRIPDGEAGDGASDGAVLLDYLKRLIPVDLAIDDFMRDGSAEPESLKVIKELVKDALDSCEVTTFSPKIGEDYRSAEGVADYPKTRVTDKPEDKFKIAEVLEKGYRIKTPDGYDVIYPARVQIFTTD